MDKEISAGGLVVFGNAILMLKKFNGDWVLPKGRVEAGEALKSTALREVMEESGVKAEIVEYIGKANYHYKNIKGNTMISKTVHWFLMTTNNMNCAPKKREGFVNAMFVQKNKAMRIAKYDDERKMISKVINITDSNCWR